MPGPQISGPERTSARLQICFQTGGERVPPPARLTKHDIVGGVSVHVLLVQVRREEFDVAAAAVDLLLVLDGELDDQGLALVAEVIKA